VLRIPRDCYRPHIEGTQLCLANAGFHHLLVYDLQSLVLAKHPLPHSLGEHYTLIWLREGHALSIGPKSWVVSLQKGSMDPLWTTDPVFHFAFGAGLKSSQRLYLVGGMNACQEDFDSDLDSAADMHASAFLGVVEVELGSMRRKVYRAVLPKALIRPAALWLESYNSLLIMGGNESLDPESPIISMDSYLFSPVYRRIWQNGQLPGLPSLIQSSQIAANHIFAVFESGDVLSCDLDTGLGVRFCPNVWNQRKWVLWVWPFTRFRLPLGVFRAVLSEFLVTKQSALPFNAYRLAV